ncbi:MAG TPA: response regulator transcription factor [Terriglobales bacterium]|nr:response regulator transcription factor [Terriglobales bacterium]
MSDQPGKPASGSAESATQLVAPIRVILADTQSLYRVGIHKIFASEDGIQLVAQPETLEKTLEAVAKFPADVLLFEASLSEEPAEVVAGILQRVPGLKVVILIDKPLREDETVECVRRGVRGIVSRSIPPELLVRCVRKVAAGEPWLDKRSVHWLAEAYRAQPHPSVPHGKLRLSEKEQVIVSLVTDGRRNKEIALELSTFEQVVKNYLRRIYERFGISDRLELAIYCLQHGLAKHGKRLAAPPARA